jgi:hypothetical protein
MANTSGWWELKVDDQIQLSTTDLEHIAEEIEKGITSGEIVEDEE